MGIILDNCSKIPHPYEVDLSLLEVTEEPSEGLYVLSNSPDDKCVTEIEEWDPLILERRPILLEQPLLHSIGQSNG